MKSAGFPHGSQRIFVGIPIKVCSQTGCRMVVVRIGWLVIILRLNGAFTFSLIKNRYFFKTDCCRIELKSLPL